MTIMTIRIPDVVKEAFGMAFEGKDKDAIVADSIGRAAAEARRERERNSTESLVERFRKFRESSSIGPSAAGDDEIREIREHLRREAGY